MPAPSSPQLCCVFRRSRNEIIPVQVMRQAAKTIQGSSPSRIAGWRNTGRSPLERRKTSPRCERTLYLQIPKDTPGVSFPGDWVATLCLIFAGLPLYRYG
jgi:hypothetical protein